MYSTGYVVNGWREYCDREGNRYYECDDCGSPEGRGHKPDCFLYDPNNPYDPDWVDDEEESH